MIWNHRALPALFLSLALAATASLGPGAVRGAPAPQAPPAPVEAATPPAVTETTIYIPYSKLREVFEKDNRGVFIPYEEFQALWKAARANAAAAPPAGPPRDALISQIDAEARVERDVAMVDATLRIEVFKRGWATVPLRLSDAAITAATIDGQPARIIRSDREGYQLLIDNPSDKPRQLELKLSFAKAVERQSGRNGVSFEAPQAPLAKWRITAPEPGVEMDVQPLLASTPAPDQPTPAARSVLLAFVGLAPTVRVNWTPRAQGATNLEAVATVRVDQRVQVEEGVVRSRVSLEYQVRRASLAELHILVPAEFKVVGVADANVKQWTALPPANEMQEVVVTLFEPAKATQSLAVDLERFTGQDKAWTVASPLVQAVGVVRQQGLLMVRIGAGLRAEAAKRTGLVQVDAVELAVLGVREVWDFAYRYSALPYGLELSVARIEPRILADTAVVARLTPEELTLSVKTVFNVERAGVFRFDMDVPAGFEVRDVTGVAVGSAKPAAIESHRVEGTDKPKLQINLSQKALGPTGVSVELVRRLDGKELLTPSESWLKIDGVAMPQPVEGSVERHQGRLTLLAPAALKVQAVDMEGLRDLGPEEQPAGAGDALRSDAGAWVALAKAYGPHPARLAIQARRSPPQTTVRQFLAVRVEPGVVKFDATFFYDIQYSGLKSLRIDLPLAVSGYAHIQTEGVHETVIQPDPEQLSPGYVAWRLTRDREFIGPVAIRINWETPIVLDVGKALEIDVPRLEPRDVFRAWGQIALARSETIDVHESGASAELRPIDPERDLMGGAGAGAARAFEFHGTWNLKVAAVHYDLEEVKHTHIARAVIRAVLTGTDQTLFQGLYRIRTAQQRLALDLPKDAVFDAQPVRINGKSVTLEKGDAGRYFIPLADQTPDNMFLLDLRYRYPAAAGGSRLDMPRFADNPAIQRQYVMVYLPLDRAFLGSRGGWDQEMTSEPLPMLSPIAGVIRAWEELTSQNMNDLRVLLKSRPVPRLNLQQLMEWVGQENAGNARIDDNFPTEGQVLLFGAIGRPGADSGSLTIVSLGRTALSVIVIAAVLLLGLILLRASAAMRWLAIGLTAMALTITAVFAPTFVRAAADDTFVAGVAVVLIAWALKYLIWTRPRDPYLAALRQARRQAKLSRLAAASLPPIAGGKESK